MTAEPVIILDNVSFAYNRELVLENVNLTIADREFVWIVGPNGGGKTTLMKIMLGLLRTQHGRVTVLGEPPTTARHRVGYLPQYAQLDRRFPVNVMDVTLMGRLGRGTAIGPYSSADRDAALEALEVVGLDLLARRSLSELSGGQQRRLLIGRALAGKPDLLLLDEPTANLDRQIERELYDLLQKLNERIAIVMVSHDPAFVSDFVEHVVCVNRTVAVHPTTDMDREFMGELYGTQVRVVRHDLHKHKEM